MALTLEYLLRRNEMKLCFIIFFLFLQRRSTAMRQAKIVLITKDKRWQQELQRLPEGSQLLYSGSNASDFESTEAREALSAANILFVFGIKGELVASLLPLLPNLEWIQCGSAGVDKLICKELADSGICITNAKGVYSYTLAEHVILSILYFNKNVDRMKRSQRNKHWDEFFVEDSRTQTLGIIGYGDIGHECARLAKSFGMRILALRRRVEKSKEDPLVDELYGPDQVGEVVAKSDFICICAALTPSTRGMVGKAEISRAQPHAVFINVGRGPLIDEQALIEALKSRTIKGAALDVFETEPLPTESPLWELDNVLLSPHCTDLTVSSWKDAVDMFVKDLKNFMEGKQLEGNRVDLQNGY